MPAQHRLCRRLLSSRSLRFCSSNSSCARVLPGTGVRNLSSSARRFCSATILATSGAACASVSGEEDCEHQWSARSPCGALPRWAGIPATGAPWRDRALLRTRPSEFFSSSACRRCSSCRAAGLLGSMLRVFNVRSWQPPAASAGQTALRLPLASSAAPWQGPGKRCCSWLSLRLAPIDSGLMGLITFADATVLMTADMELAALTGAMPQHPLLNPQALQQSMAGSELAIRTR